MRIWTIAFAIGIFAVLQLPHLPDRYWLLLVLPVLWLQRYHHWRIVAGFLLGALWCLFRSDLVMSGRLAEDIEGRDVVITGQINGLPENIDRGIRFVFQVESMHDEAGNARVSPGRVRLAWYQEAPRIRPGERWQLRVRLKRPHGFSNPGGFDYELWLFQHRIRATGYVRQDVKNRIIDPGEPHSINRVRFRLVEMIVDAMDGHDRTGLIVALATGSRHKLEAGDWRVLQRTGTGHLLAISGLHVGIVAALFFFIGRWLWALSGYGLLRLPAQDAGWLVAMIASVFYAALAGFSVPTQRALIMLLVLVLAGLYRRFFATSRILAMALLGVLCVDPLALLMPGFWLSFGAIAIILYGMTARTIDRGLWWRWGRVQYLAAIGLLPILLFWFQGVSLVSLPANIIAIPFVSLLVVPLVLLAVIMMLLHIPGAEVLLYLAGWCLQGLWMVLEGLSTNSIAWWQQGGVTFTGMLLGLTGVFILCLPRGLPARWLGGFFLLPLIFPATERPAPGHVWLTLLDVGQGLAAVVRTQEHVLVYDTGARFSERFNAGEAVVLPFLRYRGIQRVNVLMISHGDNDHFGGARAVLSGIPVDYLLTSVVDKFPGQRADDCSAGVLWFRDGVRFEILHPKPDTLYSGNNASCVMRISTGNDSVLLTGDIESQAEYAMVHRYGPDLASDVMTVPHHGSKTSSTGVFIDMIGPHMALVAAGYRNRYRFPKQAIMARYLERGIRIIDTSRHGAVTIKMTGNGYSAVSYRESRRRFWHSL